MHTARSSTPDHPKEEVGMRKPRQARRLPVLSALIVTGKGCVLPPKGPGHFFPFFTLAKGSGSCVWEFGNMNNGRSFGGDKQYGKVGPGTMGAFAGRVRS